MSSIFRSPKKPDLPPEQKPVEELQTITEEADVAARKRKRRVLTGGRRATILSGIQSALKKRLGE